MQYCTHARLQVRAAVSAQCCGCTVLHVCKAASAQCCERAGLPVCMAPLSEQGDPSHVGGDKETPPRWIQHRLRPAHPPALLPRPRHHGLGWEKPFGFALGPNPPARSSVRPSQAAQAVQAAQAAQAVQAVQAAQAAHQLHY